MEQLDSSNPSSSLSPSKPLSSSEITGPIHLVTHSETFHCDEVTAAALLQLLFGISKITRTRNQDMIDRLNSEGAFVVDVGRRYDHVSHLYDHHQASFTDTFDRTSSIGLSSAGLIWRHYGSQLLTKLNTDNKFPSLTPEAVSRLHRKFYYSTVVSIDANDVGVPYIKSEMTSSDLFNFRSQLTLGKMVSSFNNQTDPDGQNGRFTEAFRMVTKLMNNLLVNCLRSHHNYIANQQLFQAAFNNLLDDGIMVLGKKFDVNQYLKKFDPTQRVKLIVVPRDKTKWQVWTVNPPGKRFEQLVPLLTPEDAKTLLGDELVFLHNARFIGVTKSDKSAIELAQASLQKQRDHDNRVTQRLLAAIKSPRTWLGATLVVGSIAAAVAGVRRFR